METTKAERIRLGVFLILSIVLVLGIMVFYLGKQLTNERTNYYTRFAESVDGLVPGAKVKWNGVTVGQVVLLNIDEKNLQEVIVHFEVEKGTPIKASMSATLVGGLSITGLKSIELTGGTPEEKILKENKEVQAGVSQMKVLTGQTERIVLKLEELMNNLLAVTGEKNQASFTNSLQNVNLLTAQLADAKIDKTLLGIQNATTEIEAVTKRADMMLLQSQDDFVKTMKHAKQISENMDDFSRQIKDNPSVIIRGDDKQKREK